MMIARMASAVMMLSCAIGLLSAADDAPHGHVAVHGGCLNEIGACENGHAEARVEGTRLRLWLVGGGSNTAAALRIVDPSIVLTTKATAAMPAHTLTLVAKPLILAEEKIGFCSYFEAEAEWLAGIAQLESTGSITFNGKKIDLIVNWPVGYDPDHDAETKPGSAPTTK
jgi:hypothetical protein